MNRESVRLAAEAGVTVVLDPAGLRELDAAFRALELAPEPTAAVENPGAPESWRERVWTVPAETRLSIGEAAEALNRSRSWLYKRTAPSSTDPIPHAKTAGGVLTFTAGALRDVIRGMEEEGPRLRAVQ